MNARMKLIALLTAGAMLVACAAVEFGPLLRVAHASLSEVVAYSQVLIGELQPVGPTPTTVSGIYMAPGAQLGIGGGSAGAPIGFLTGIYPVSFPITATTLNQSALSAQTVTATVTGLVTATNPDPVCGMTSYATATAGQPTGVVIAQIDFLTGTSPATGSSAAPLVIQVKIENMSPVTVTSAQGVMHCDVFTTNL